MANTNYYVRINGCLYMTAKQIENYMSSRLSINFAKDGKGNTHPGTVFNNILNSMPLIARHKLGLNNSSIACVDCSKNPNFCQDMIDCGAITKQSIKRGSFDIYTLSAATILIKFLIRNEQIKKYFTLSPLEEWTLEQPYHIQLAPKNFNPKLAAPSLIGRAAVPKKYRVIDEFTPEEQEVIRRYQLRVKETRKDGSRKVYRRS